MNLKPLSVNVFVLFLRRKPSHRGLLDTKAVAWEIYRSFGGIFHLSN